MPSLTIIGAGQVGKCLGYLLANKANLEIKSVLNRSLTSASQACEFLGQGQACDDFSQVQAADYYLIAVQDDQILAAAEKLQHHLNLGPANLVFHCSGALSSEQLAVIAATGAATASLHPLKSFIDPQLSVTGFSGTPCTIEGSPAALVLLKKWIKQIGGQCLEISPQAKIIYHAGAVIACNYLAAITATALDCWQHIGIAPDQGLQILTPLLESALGQLLSKGPAEALTGPIARGDAKLIAQQIAALADYDEEVATLYKQLGKVALRLAANKKNPAATLAEVAELL